MLDLYYRRTKLFSINYQLLIKKMPRPKRPITFGHVVFNVIYTLAFPAIATFAFLYTVLVWIFSIPSKIIAFIASKL